jgi:SAM-dependent methyltransferase
MSRGPQEATGAAEIVWHDVECGGYDADLRLWERLAGERGGPILELGCGTGRVLLHLAARDHDVTGVDRDEALAAEAASRAAGRGFTLAVARADARELRLERRFNLVLAPMQLFQLLDGADGRRRALEAIARHLLPQGILAAAIVEGEPSAALGEGSAAVPDVGERDGWIYSSLPLEVLPADGHLIVRRLRQTVASGGDLSEAIDTVQLDVVEAPQLEAQARSAGLVPAGRLAIEPTDAHLGSTVVLLEQGGQA